METIFGKLTGEEVERLDLQYNLHPWAKQGNKSMAIEKSEGIYFWDYEGNKYADMSSLLVNMNLGHSNKDIINAIHEQVDKMAFMSPGFSTEPKSLLSKLIIDLMPDNMSKVLFTNGGTESNEHAIKIARTVTGRLKIFSRYRSYHGATSGSANASGDTRRFSAEIAAIPGYIKFEDPYMYRSYFNFESEKEATKYYLTKLEEQLIYENPYNVAAIILEPITGANGIIIPPEGYLEGVRALCDKYGIMMICDEVMSGFGRTGKMFGFQHYNIKPDIVTFAKGVTCGYIQLGGVVVSKEISEYFNHHVLQSGMTYCGHTLACAAGVACVKYYEKNNILDKVNEMGNILANFLDEMVEKHPCVGEARHIGLFTALELVKSKETKEPLVEYGKPNSIMSSIMGELRKRGFSTFGRENNINICPPLIITKEELEEYLPILDEVLTIVDNTYVNVKQLEQV